MWPWSWKCSLLVRNNGCKRKKNKLKSISVCVHWSAKSRSRSQNFVLVGKNSSMPTTLPSKAYMWLMVWKKTSWSQFQCVFTEAQSQGEGHKILCWSGRTHQCLQPYQVRHTCEKWCERKQGKVNISVCSLKREVKVKVTKFCIGREELINVNKLTKFDFCIINGLWETKLNATAKRNS